MLAEIYSANTLENMYYIHGLDDILPWSLFDVNANIYFSSWNQPVLSNEVKSFLLGKQQDTKWGLTSLLTDYKLEALPTLPHQLSSNVDICDCI